MIHNDIRPDEELWDDLGDAGIYASADYVASGKDERWWLGWNDDGENYDCILL